MEKTSEAENLVQHFEFATPKIVDAWIEERKRGYQARLDGISRNAIRGRGGRKGMWLQGWDKANADIARVNTQVGL